MKQNLYIYYKDFTVKYDSGTFTTRSFHTYALPWSKDMKKMFPEYVGPFETTIELPE